jgi:hypothetical protein
VSEKHWVPFGARCGQWERTDLPPLNRSRACVRVWPQEGGHHARIKYTVEQIIAKLREAEVALSQRQTVVQVSRSLGITEQTYYRWRNEYVG